MILAGERSIEIPAAEATALLDPTGCGDAYRAGLLYGMMTGADWETTGRLAATMGALKIASHGTQNHSPNPESVSQSFKKNFGYDPGL